MENQCLICLGIFLWSNNHLITNNNILAASLFGKQIVCKLVIDWWSVVHKFHETLITHN